MPEYEEPPTAFLDGQPIHPHIAQDVLTSCLTAISAITHATTLIDNYLHGPWYYFRTRSRQRAILLAHHDIFRTLDHLNAKIRHVYSDRTYLDIPVASAGGVYNVRMLSSSVQPWGKFVLPSWVQEVQKGADKMRQYASWLRSREATALAKDYGRVYDEMLEVYEMRRLGLQAVVGMMKGILAALEGGDKQVWRMRDAREVFEGVPLYRWR